MTSPAQAQDTTGARASVAPAVSEVIVTATKRPEELGKLAGSVTALSGQSLQESGATGYSSYLAKVPGVVLNDSIPGYSTVVIRGIATTAGFDQGQGTTGFYVNDIPLTDPSLSLGNPDIDTFDVRDVAVLRGPQGSLYGASALGGAINYQTTMPNLTNSEFGARATFSSTAHGADGGGVNLLGNMPFADGKLAVRAVYADRIDAGFIDNIGTGRKDTNRTETQSGRVLARWRPVDGTTVDYMFLYEDQDTEDRGFQEPIAAGFLRKKSAVAEPADLTTKINSLTLTQDTSIGTLTAQASYVKKDIDQILDNTTAPLAARFANRIVPLVVELSGGDKAQNYEVRIASPAGRAFEYVGGLFYNSTDYNLYQPIYGPGGTAVVESLFAAKYGAGVGQIAAAGDTVQRTRIILSSKEYAAFGEVSYHFNPQLKLTLGGRLFDAEISGGTQQLGVNTLIQTGKPNLLIDVTQKSKGFLPKASLSWTPTETLMFYGLLSKGFRIGGPNITAPDPNFPTPATFRPDTLYNYEVGVRTTIAHQLQLSVTAFYIDWSNIQLRFLSPAGFSFAANAGKAKSRGLEGSAVWSPGRGLNLSASVSYLDAELSNPFNPGTTAATIVPAGTQLPGAPTWQSSETIDYAIGPASLDPKLSLSHRYTGNARSAINNVGGYQGGYNIFDLRYSLAYKGWDGAVFANNLFDVRGVTYGTTAPGPLAQYVTRPRTIGVTLGTRF